MTDLSTRLIELLEKLLTGGGPAYLVALAIQLAYFRHLDLVRHRGYLLPGGLIALWFAIALPLTVASWAIMPRALVEFFAPHQSLSGDWVFLLLLPSILAAAIGVMTTCWLAGRARDAAAA